MTRQELYDKFNMNCVNVEDCSQCKCCNDETGDLVLCALMFGYYQGKLDTVDECIDKLYEVTPQTLDEKLDMVFVHALKELKENK